MAGGLRRADRSDAAAIAELYLRARKAARATIPLPVHPDDEVRAWIEDVVLVHRETWLAEDTAGAPAGMIVLDEDWVDQLYVEPALTGSGIGTRLLELAKRERPGGLRLWTFEANLGARRFYERHGFAAAGATAGDNEEGAPDILYVWPAPVDDQVSSAASPAKTST